MVQSRVAQYVTSRYQNRSSVTEKLQELGWRTLEERRKEMHFTTSCKIMCGGVAIDGVRSNSLNENKKKLLEDCNTNTTIQFQGYLLITTNTLSTLISSHNGRCYQKKLSMLRHWPPLERQLSKYTAWTEKEETQMKCQQHHSCSTFPAIS